MKCPNQVGISVFEIKWFNFRFITLKFARNTIMHDNLECIIDYSSIGHSLLVSMTSIKEKELDVQFVGSRIIEIIIEKLHSKTIHDILMISVRMYANNNKLL